MLAISSLNAIGKSANASILGFGHKVILILIFSIIGGWIASITGVFIGIALAHIVSLFLVSKLFIRKVWRKDEHKADLPYDFCELRNGD
jgi:Na+-driven multidrug efflux pump